MPIESCGQCVSAQHGKRYTDIGLFSADVGQCYDNLLSTLVSQFNLRLYTVAYMISNFGIQIPLMFIMSMCALSVSAYGRAGHYMIG